MYDESGLSREKTLMTSADTCTSALLFADLCSMAWVHLHPRARSSTVTKGTWRVQGVFGDQRGTVSRVSFGEDKVDVQIN